MGSRVQSWANVAASKPKTNTSSSGENQIAFAEAPLLDLSKSWLLVSTKSNIASLKQCDAFECFDTCCGKCRDAKFVMPEKIRKMWHPVDAKRMPRIWGTRCYDCGAEKRSGWQVGNISIGGIKTFPQESFGEDEFNICVICYDCYRGPDVIMPPKDAETFKARQRAVWMNNAVAAKVAQYNHETNECTRAVRKTEAMNVEIKSSATHLNGQERYLIQAVRGLVDKYHLKFYRESDLRLKLIKIHSDLNAFDQSQFSAEMEKIRDLQTREKTLVDLCDLIRAQRDAVDRLNIPTYKWFSGVRLLALRRVDLEKTCGDLSDQIVGDMTKDLDTFMMVFDHLASFLQQAEGEPLHQQADEPVKETYEPCAICSKTFNNSDILTLGCDHKVCKMCWRGRIQMCPNALDARSGIVRCPDRYCRAPLTKDGSRNHE